MLSSYSWWYASLIIVTLSLVAFTLAISISHHIFNLPNVHSDMRLGPAIAFVLAEIVMLVGTMVSHVVANVPQIIY